MKYMSKLIYANMGVKSFIRTSTIQPAAPLSKVHDNILNLKNKKNVRFPLYFLEFPLYFWCGTFKYENVNFYDIYHTEWVYFCEHSCYLFDLNWLLSSWDFQPGLTTNKGIITIRAVLGSNLIVYQIRWNMEYDLNLFENGRRPQFCSR